MTHSNPNDQHGPRAFPSRNDGDSLARLFATMIADYYIEAARWPRTRSESIRLAAEALWGIRDRLILGDITFDNAAVWFDEGFRYLDKIMNERCRKNHPAGGNRR